MHLLPGYSHLLCQCGERCCLRLSVRHIKHCGHATVCCSPTLCLHICLMRQSRLTEMHMRVYHSRQHIRILGINYNIKGIGTLGVNSSLYDIFYSVVNDKDISLNNMSLINQRSFSYQCLHYKLLYRFSHFVWSRRTVKSSILILWQHRRLLRLLRRLCHSRHDVLILLCQLHILLHIR